MLSLCVQRHCGLVRPRVDAMGKQLPSKKPSSAIFPCSKKGKTRLLLKTNLTKKPVGKSSQTRLWQKVPYVRDGFVLRMDRMKMEAKSQGFAQCGRGPHGGYPNRRRILARLEQDEVSVLQQQRGVLIAETRWSSTTVSLPQQELPQVYLATSSSPRVHFRQRGRRTFSCCARLCSNSCVLPASRFPAFTSSWT